MKNKAPKIELMPLFLLIFENRCLRQSLAMEVQTELFSFDNANEAHCYVEKLWLGSSWMTEESKEEFVSCKREPVTNQSGRKSIHFASVTFPSLLLSMLLVSQTHTHDQVLHTVLLNTG